MPSDASPVALDRFTTFGDLLKYLRRRQGLTQRELSIAVGYSHAQISRLELNQRLPDLATIAARFVPALDLEGEPATAARLMDLAVAVQRDDAPASGAPPFKGLRYFDETDADLFFGRESLTNRLVDQLLAADAAAGPRFLAVVGASGSGKSSIVRAGLIPALHWQRAAPPWIINTLTPTTRPLQALAAAQNLEAAPGAAACHLLVVDQFEELFTLCGDENERQAFIDRLLAASQPPAAASVVITLRADFYAQCAPYAALRDALAASQVFIGPMTSDELRRAVEEPARRGGWDLEAGLVDLLLKDLGADGRQPPEPGALPLLAHALLETWHRRRGRMLTVSGYLASGGVRGAIAETADVVYHDALEPGQQAIARDIFLRLTQLGDEEGAAETRRRVALSELMARPETAAAVRVVLTHLADARLITTDGDAVDVAHEALIREWPTLRGWLEADRDGLRLHRRLTLAAEGWRHAGGDPGELYRGARLAQAAEWAAQHPAALNDPEREFLAASQAQAEHEAAEREAQRQRELAAARTLAETQGRAAASLRRRAVYLGIALVLALGMTGAAIYFGEQARQSALQALAVGRLATARELAAAAVSNLAVDPERGILLALQAISTTRTVGEPVASEAESALHQSLLASRVRLSLADVGTRVLAAVFSPDGSRLAAIGDTGDVAVWAANTGALVFTLPGSTIPGDAVGLQRIAYSPDGQRLATGDRSLVKIWDAASGAALAELEGHTGEVWSVAYSPDGRWIASTATDGALLVWDASTGLNRLRVTAHAAFIESLAFSPDGLRVATGSEDNVLRVWDVHSGTLVYERADFTAPVYSLAYSPDGRYLASAASDSVLVWDAATFTLVREFRLSAGFVTFSPDSRLLAAAVGSNAFLWEVATGRELLNLPGHTNWVNTVAFHPAERQLLTSSMDGTVRTWDLGPGREALALAANGLRVAYSPDGRWLATDGTDGIARIWDASSGRLAAELAGHSAGLWGVAWGADGARLATASTDGTARVWDPSTGQGLLTLAGHGAGLDDPGLAVIRDVAFSQDGTRVATAGFDGTARLWDAHTGAELRQLVGHASLVVGVAFSPDGSRLATTGTDGNILLWDTATGQQVLAMHSHDGANPDIVFSPDGGRLLTGGSDAVARVWDAASGELILSLSGHRAFIWSVSWSPDGRLVATGSADGTARVWDAATGTVLSTLFGSAGDVDGVAFSPRDGGADLAVASSDGVVRVFLLRLDELLSLAHTRLTRGLTLGECQTFLHVAACPTAPAPPSP